MTELLPEFSSSAYLTDTQLSRLKRIPAFAIEADFLTGSYRRWTKTKPLKDVDIFCVLAQKEKHYREKAPAVLLADVEAALIDEYGKENVSCQRRSVTVNFGVVEVDGETNDQVMSFDVVPAFTKGDHYEIPDTAVSSGWTETNPKIHAEKAVKAQEAYAGEWKGLVRMMKAWNRQQGKPVKPSFLLEVMALDMLHPPWLLLDSRVVELYEVVQPDFCHDLFLPSPYFSMPLKISEASWAPWKPQTPESNKSVRLLAATIDGRCRHFSPRLPRELERPG